MKHKFEKDIEYSVNLSEKEPEFLMRIGFDAISEILLSIAHRKLSNRGSGLVWDKETESWTRIIDGIKLSNAYEENKKDARIYHKIYEEHIKLLKLREKGLGFIIISNGNLGNNPWHVAWQYDKDKKIYRLKKEPFLDRTYTCFIVPRDKTKKSRIEKVGFDKNENLFNEKGEKISENTNWVNYGQQIVRTKEGKTEPVPIEEIIEQFSDVRHVFDLKDYGESKERDASVISGLYEGYPESFKEKMLEKLRTGFPRAKYYHSTLGIKENGIVLYHYYGKVEEIAKRLVDKGVKDSIILDQGGSVGVYASWLNGFLSKSSYFRPERISTIAFVLK